MVRLWDVETGQTKATLLGQAGTMESIAFSPDGAWPASASGDTTVWLWDVTIGQPVAALQGHTGSVTSVAFSRDGAAGLW